jgi:hypothetical protein
MMFPKPEKKVKIRNTYNSLQQRSSKPKKEIAPWRKDILSSHQSNPSRADRAEFSRKVVEELILETGGLCQCGCGRPASSTHHVMPRGRNGRGVKKNAMRTNDICHIRIQTNEEELQYWISEWERKFGANFWFDEQDWEEFNRKQAAADKIKQGKQIRAEQLDPIVELLTVATGRTLKAKELRLLDKLGVSDMAIFARLMADVVGAGLVTTTKPEFGYGQFDD